MSFDAFVVDIIIYVLSQQFRISAKFAQAAKTLNDSGTKITKKEKKIIDRNERKKHAKKRMKFEKF